MTRDFQSPDPLSGVDPVDDDLILQIGLSVLNGGG